MERLRNIDIRSEISDYVAIRPSLVDFFPNQQLFYASRLGDKTTYVPYAKNNNMIGAERVKERLHPTLFIQKKDKQGAMIEAQLNYYSFLNEIENDKDPYTKIDKFKSVITDWVGETLSSISNNETHHIEDLYKTVDILIRTFDTDFLALSKEITNLDYTTALHSTNTMIYTINYHLKSGLKKTDPYLRTVGIAALLHDIGKEKVAPEILLKADKLTPKERAEVQNHPNYGVYILNQAKKQSHRINDEIVEVCQKHHERINGEGYPYRLTNENISKLTKVIMIIDFFEATTGFRPYNEKLTPFEALNLIKDQVNAGIYPEEEFTRFVKSFPRKNL